MRRIVMTKNQYKQTDMTQGPILPTIISFSIPLLIGNLFQLLYNTVDSVVIGNFVGTDALAAVGACNSPMLVLLSVLLGLSGGISVLVSQIFGRGDLEELEKAVSTASGFFMLSVVPLTVCFVLLIEPLLTIIDIQEAAREYARVYLLVVFLGMIGSFGFNLNSGILRGLGDSRSPLLFLLIACILNILLDLFFVLALDLGVFGVAIATVIAQVASWLYSLWHIKRHFAHLSFRLFTFRVNRSILKRMIALGLPMVLNHGIYSLGFLLYYRFVNGFGPVYMAGYGVGGKLDNLSWLPISSLGTAAMTFAGQNSGAGNLEGLRKGLKVILKTAISINILTSALTLLLGRQLMSLFSPDPLVIEAGFAYLVCLSPFYWIYAIMYVLSNYMNGVGDVRYPTLITMIMFWCVRLPVAWYLSTHFGGNVLHLAFPASWTAGCIMMVIYYFKRFRRKYLAAEA